MTPPLRFPVLRHVAAGEKCGMPCEPHGYALKTAPSAGLHVRFRDEVSVAFLTDEALAAEGYHRRVKR